MVQSPYPPVIIYFLNQPRLNLSRYLAGNPISFFFHIRGQIITAYVHSYIFSSFIIRMDFTLFIIVDLNQWYFSLYKHIVILTSTIIFLVENKQSSVWAEKFTTSSTVPKVISLHWHSWKKINHYYLVWIEILIPWCQKHGTLFHGIQDLKVSLGKMWQFSSKIIQNYYWYMRRMLAFTSTSLLAGNAAYMHPL